MPKTHGLALSSGLLILLVALFVRGMGLAFGQPTLGALPTLPSSLSHSQAILHPDEYFYVSIPLDMQARGTLNPRFFENPSFLIYLNYLTNFFTGFEVDTRHWDGQSLRNYAPFPLYFIARSYSMLAGILTVAAVIALTRRLSDWRSAAFAGLMASLAFPLVQHSHYATTSSLAAAFVTFALWGCVRTIQAQSYRSLIFAALMTGLAIGSRYNAAAVSFALCLTGLLFFWQKRSVSQALKVGLAWSFFPLSFFVTTPFALFDFEEFWQQFTYIYGVFTVGRNPAAFTPFQGLWLEYQYIIVMGLGGFGAILALFGIGRLFQRDKALLLIFLAFIVPYSYVVLRTAMPQVGDQLTLLVIPLFCVFGGLALRQFGAWRVPMLLLASATLILQVLLLGALWNSFIRPENRELAQTWINTHISTGTEVWLLGGYNVPLDAEQYPQRQFFNLLEAQTAYQGEAVYLLLSDAVIFAESRRTGQDYSSLLTQYLAPFADFNLVQVWERPRWLGDQLINHNATYWHQPALYLYCHPQRCP